MRFTRYSHDYFVWAAMMLLVQLPLMFMGCTEQQQKLPEYDAYMTWSNYYGVGNPTAALYIWNGTPIGRGDDGISNIFIGIKTLPVGSKLLIYPQYPYDKEVDGPNRHYPFERRLDEIDILAKERKILLIESQRDYQGNENDIPPASTFTNSGTTYTNINQIIGLGPSPLKVIKR